MTTETKPTKRPPEPLLPPDYTAAGDATGEHGSAKHERDNDA